MIPYSRSKRQTAESVLIEILSSKTQLTTKAAFSIFKSKYHSKMTLQGFYKLVKNLLEDQVIVKENGLLSIDIAWVQNLIDFTEGLKNTYIDSDKNNLSVILEKGESKEFIFGSVLELYNFWDHALLVTSNHQKEDKKLDRNMYSTNYYAWNQILRTKSNFALLKTFETDNVDWFLVSASDTKLNQLTKNILDNSNFHFKIGNFDQKSGLNENSHATVLGNYIFEVELPLHIFHAIKKIFDDFVDLSSVDITKIDKMIREFGSCNLKITNDPKRAKVLREKIRLQFK